MLNTMEMAEAAQPEASLVLGLNTEEWVTVERDILSKLDDLGYEVTDFFGDADNEIREKYPNYFKTQAAIDRIKLAAYDPIERSIGNLLRVEREYLSMLASCGIGCEVDFGQYLDLAFEKYRIGMVVNGRTSADPRVRQETAQTMFEIMQLKNDGLDKHVKAGILKTGSVPVNFSDGSSVILPVYRMTMQGMHDMGLEVSNYPAAFAGMTPDDMGDGLARMAAIQTVLNEALIAGYGGDPDIRAYDMLKSLPMTGVFHSLCTEIRFERPVKGMMPTGEGVMRIQIRKVDGEHRFFY